MFIPTDEVVLRNINGGFQRAGLRTNYLEGEEGIVRDVNTKVKDCQYEVLVKRKDGCTMVFYLNEDCMELKMKGVNW